ncbi:MAG: gamma-glutamylcyclotransferase [Rhodospirillaceae bacterium]|jgi:glutathione-specific gamma-glutamylcyclotransferase|nr:gamma-glutamylcyclotransferase [Rhodospirillaceae bacterium]MBT4043337.1 gamma-glutamylcyclotransferase [Rhodospirillaceae bacterium]MBT4690204.1 gamma-glutamylcyclotransferase [Rhodospirillaceae bacterium]MBT5080769.1 gamma-glutamylcyclotransferase [Rhodospirillaceae bacterium]MBT5525191.1 gamma-glutamylcyclotransferase [Rhodospirillaceae bacterium]
MRRFKELFQPLSAAAREQSCRDALAGRPEPLGNLWIFGYGSLMWDAPFPHAEVVPVQLLKWHRAMSIWTALARGTPDCPGLSLGLLPGGVCDGVAFRIAKADQAQALPIIWEREMWTDTYRPTWVSVDIDGVERSALTFTTNLDSGQYAAGLGQDQIIEHIALAHGERGPCRDYLTNVVAELDALGITDRYLTELAQAVAARPKA